MINVGLIYKNFWDLLWITIEQADYPLGRFMAEFEIGDVSFEVQANYRVESGIRYDTHIIETEKITGYLPNSMFYLTNVNYLQYDKR